MLLFALSLTAWNSARAQDEVTLNLLNTDIESMVKLMSEITGRVFVLDPRVKGTVSIVSAKPVRRSQVYSLFLTALRSQGFAAVEAAGATRIVPEPEARLHPGPTVERRGRVGGDRFATLVYPLKHESAAQVMPVLRLLIPNTGAIGVVPDANVLVITDYADNLNRLAGIIEAIDRAEPQDITAVSLEHASAVDIAPVVARMLDTPVPPGVPARFQILPDLRSNRLLVRTREPELLARIIDLVRKLDVPARPQGGNVRVVYLRNAEAPRLAEILRALVAAESRASLPGAGGAGAPAVAPAPLKPPVPGTGGAPAPAPQAPAEAPAPGAAAPPASFIQADPATNSIIISAPDAIYNALRPVIEQLDARRAQVYLEALIAEVTADKAAELGIQFQSLSGAGEGVNDRRLIGGTSFQPAPGVSIQGAAQNFAAVPPGLTVGVVRGRVTLPGVGEVLNLNVLARALESDSDANILSTPNLLTMDNEEANIVVGQNVPFITGSFAQAGAVGPGVGVNPFQTIERRDVGLTLRVRPQVAEGRTVKLRIYQEVSSIQDVTNAAGIITNKRAIESAVLVEDGEIVVLGGLIQDDVRNSVDKVPLLGDLPILGALFRYEARRRIKTNLMVFLRPVVLREPGAAHALTGDRYDYIRNEQARMAPPPRAVLPDIPSPTLPAWPEH